MEQENNLNGLEENKVADSEKKPQNKSFWYLLILVLVALGGVLVMYFYQKSDLEKSRIDKKQDVSEIKSGIKIDMDQRIENPETEDLQRMMNNILEDRNF